MITPGVLLPQKSIQNALPLETPPPTGAVEGGVAGFFLGERHNLLGDEVLRGTKLYDAALNPGKTISYEEWKNDPTVYRPGLEFSKKGGSYNVAKVNADSYDREGYLQDELANLRSGVMPWTASTLGNLIGFAADPNNIATGFAAAELMGPGRAIVARALEMSGRGAQVGAEAGLGAIQQGTAFTPFALADYDVSNQLGQKPTALSVMANIGMAAGLGAVIHGYIKNKQIITTQAHETALQTAATQTLNGQRVDVEDIVKKGYNEARASEGKTEEPTPDVQDEISEALRYKTEQMQDRQQELQSLLDTESLKSTLRTVGAESLEKPREDLLEQVNRIETKSAFLRSPEERMILENIPKSEEFQKALMISRKPEAERSPDENTFMRSYQAGEEPMMIKNRLEVQRKQIADLQQQLKEIKPDSKKADTLKAQVADLNDRIDAGNDRLADLEGHPQETPAIQEARQAVEKAQSEVEQLKDLAQSHQLELHMQETPELPVTPADVEDTVKKQGTWENDTALQPDDIKEFDRQVESIPISNEQILSEIESAIDDLRKAGNLTEEDMHILDELQRYDDASEKYEASLKAFRDCIMGGRK